MTEFQPDHTIVIERTLNATREQVYAAWTEPELMKRWIAQQVEADVRVGGRYRNEIQAGEQTFVHIGEYIALDPGQRVLQTFRAGGVEPNPYTNEFIEVTLEVMDAGRTKMTFTNGWNGPALDDEAMQATRQGWSGWLDLLEALF